MMDDWIFWALLAVAFVAMIALAWFVYREGQRKDATLTEEERYRRWIDSQW